MRVEASYDEVRAVHEHYKNSTYLDYEFGMLKIGNLPIIWARAAILYNIYIEMYKLLGESVLAIMHRIGRAYGIDFYKLILKRFDDMGAEKTVESIYKYVCSETAAIGWGRILIEDENGGEIKLTCEKGFPVGRLCAETHECPSMAVDSYFLGYFEGLFSALHGRNLLGKEVECVAKGDDKCVMVFKQSQYQTRHG